MNIEELKTEQAAVKKEMYAAMDQTDAMESNPGPELTLYLSARNKWRKLSARLMSLESVIENLTKLQHDT